jgi:hypothetical protein
LYLANIWQEISADSTLALVRQAKQLVEVLLLYWYLHRFIGRWPFAGTLTEPELLQQLDCSSLCPLAGCRARSTPLARSG